MNNSIGCKLNESRNMFIDCIKGIAIFLMLYGHSMQYCYPHNRDIFNDKIFQFIYSFHMPLFMIISGYLFALSSFKIPSDLLRKKVISISHMLIGGSSLLFLFWDFPKAIISKNYIDGILNGSIFGEINSLWYLWSLLACSLVMCLYAKLNNKILKLFILLLGFVIVALFPNYMINIYMYPYFVAGYFLYKYKQKLSKFIGCAYCSFLLFPVALIFYSKKHFIYTTGIFSNQYSIIEYFIIDVFRWIIGFFGIAFIVSLLMIIKKFKIFNKLICVFSKLGKETLQIYVLSVVFISYYLRPLCNFLCKNQFVNNIYLSLSKNTLIFDLALALPISIIYTILLYYLSILLKKAKVSKLLFGR